MILPGSYANGFAPRDGRPLYPELWRNCVGAWAPCIGPTGLTLRDWSIQQNHGALNNFATTAWTPSFGSYGLAFDGTNDYVSLPVMQNPPSSGVFLMSLINRAQTGSGSGATYFSYYATDASLATNLWECEQDDSSGTFRVLIRGSAGTLIDAMSPSGWFVTNEPLRIAIVMPPTGGLQLWKNGVQTTVTFRSGSSTTRAWFSDVTGPTISTIGRLAAAATRYPNCIMKDVRVTGMCDPKIATLRSGIAYELAPRRRASVQVITGNRRRRLLVGAHS